MSAPSALGERIRQLRIARGLTQTKLGLDRFSKEYVSQIERGRVRPNDAALEWLAERLEVPRRFLETGVSSPEHEHTASVISQAEAAVAAREFDRAIASLDGLGETGAALEPDLELRAALAGAAARSELGRIEEALAVLMKARDLVDDESFTDVDRANVLFHIGQCRYRLSSVPTAVALFTEALELMRRSEAIDDRLRCRILRWRSRCYRRQGDWEAARADVEAALELSRAARRR